MLDRTRLRLVLIPFVLSSCGPQRFTVTGSGDGHEDVAPSGPPSVLENHTITFTVTGAPCSVPRVVEGTCPQGSWQSDSLYRTGRIEDHCTLSFLGSGCPASNYE
jgi:hypothetical protein